MAIYSGKNVLTVESRQSIELSLADVVRDGTLQIFPDVEARGLLHVQFRRGRVVVTAGRYIGLVPLTDNISIDVRPKLPVSNLGRVLDQSRVSIGLLKGARRLYKPSNNGGVSVVEFLLSNLLNEISPIRTFGFHKDYIRALSSSSSPRGRIRLRETISQHYSRGSTHRVVDERFAQSSDTAPNRSIKSALQHLVHLLNRSGGDRKLISAANAAYSDFPEIIGPAKFSDYEECHEILMLRSLPYQREYYYRPLEIALLVLSGRAIELDGRGGALNLDSFIVDFESVFEQYIRRCLSSAAPEGIAVKDGNHEGRKRLYDDRKDPPAQPDIVLEDRINNRRAVVEIKYKEKPDRPDVNQAITYAVTYRTNRVILVHQRKIGTAGGLQRLGIMNGITIDSYGFDLAREDLEDEERAIGAVLFEILAVSSAFGPG